MNKEYTAAEMREAANDLETNANDIIADCNAQGGSTDRTLYKEYAEYDAKCAAMLRQAAETCERAEELKNQCLKICGRGTCDHKGDKCVCCARDVIDFIVRGDNGNEEK